MGLLRSNFGHLCRTTRIRLDITQAQLARAVGVTRAYISAIEVGRANPTIKILERTCDALGLELSLVPRTPIVIGSRQRDLVHARCSAYVQRRLQAIGLVCLREVEIVHGRSHGWIDILAFDRATGTLFIIEVKTSIDDVGGAERQLGWYERAGPSAARLRGWNVRRAGTWLLVLASEGVEEVIRVNREVLRVACPVRAVAMRRQLTEPGSAGEGRGLALIDPSSRRRDWLLASRLDGRRGQAPYRDYADAASRWRETAGARRAPERPGAS